MNAKTKALEHKKSDGRKNNFKGGYTPFGKATDTDYRIAKKGNRDNYFIKHGSMKGYKYKEPSFSERPWSSQK
jgi:hypothetical protein